MVVLAMKPFHALFLTGGSDLNGSNCVVQAPRGIYSQIPGSKGKLVRVPQGTVFDVAADLRCSSCKFHKHAPVEITGENGQMLRIPEGFGHAFLALSRVVGFTSRVTDFSSAPAARAIAWNQPGLFIPRPIGNSEAIVSEKNSRGLRIADAEVSA